MWRLSEATPDNLGLAFTDDGLLLGRAPLIKRRNGCFVVREWFEIARLVKYSFPDGVAADRLMPGLARIAAALNANDHALARIAAVHLQISDLPSAAAPVGAALHCKPEAIASNRSRQRWISRRIISR